MSVEFDARDGLVYSVLYSDRVEALSYTGCTSTMANIVNRSKENRKEAEVTILQVFALAIMEQIPCQRQLIQRLKLRF